MFEALDNSEPFPIFLFKSTTISCTNDQLDENKLSLAEITPTLLMQRIQRIDYE